MAGRCKEHWVGCPCCQRSEKLFQDTPDDKKLCYVKEEVFEITDGGPIIDTDHPVIKEMFEIPITGALCCSLNLYGLLFSNPLIAVAAALGWQVITNQRFCLRRAENQGKPRCFRTGCIQASKSSSTFSVRTAHYRRQFFPRSFDPVFPLFIRPAFFFRDCRRLVPLQEGPRAIQPQAR